MTSRKSGTRARQAASTRPATFDPQAIGFTLLADQETLEELERIDAKAARAEQSIRKFAMR